MLPSLAKFECDFFGDFQTMCRKGTVLFSNKEGAGAARWCFVCFAVRCRWVPDRHGISRTIIQTLVQKLQNRENLRRKFWILSKNMTKCKVQGTFIMFNWKSAIFFFWNKLFLSLKSFLSYWWWVLKKMGTFSSQSTNLILNNKCDFKR